METNNTPKLYKLIGSDGKQYLSPNKGQFGGYWRGKQKIYGRLDCKSALRWISKGHYVKYRVFFATREDAESAGFRPCKICNP
jgi:hypothetical protein